MIKADVIVANKKWKKYISNPKFYIDKKLKKFEKNLALFKKNNFNYTFDKIWVHGFVHLFGYRHRLNKDFEEMQKIENKILNLIN